MINFPSSPAILIGDSPPTLWPCSTQVTNVFPWKQTCRATVPAGLSNEIQLCQRGTGWWPDWSHISTTGWLLTIKSLLNWVWALAVIVRHMHITLSFGLFVSHTPFFYSFVSVYLSSYVSFFLSLPWFAYKGLTHLSLRTPALRGEKKFFPPCSVQMVGIWLRSHGWKKLRKLLMIRKKNGRRLRHTDKSVTLMETSNFTVGKKNVFPYTWVTTSASAINYRLSITDIGRYCNTHLLTP